MHLVIACKWLTCYWNMHSTIVGKSHRHNLSVFIIVLYIFLVFQKILNSYMKLSKGKYKMRNLILSWPMEFSIAFDTVMSGWSIIYSGSHDVFKKMYFFLVSRVRCGTLLYRFMIFAFFCTHLSKKDATDRGRKMRMKISRIWLYFQ